MEETIGSGEAGAPRAQHRLVVVGVVRNLEQELLIVRSAGREWELPGGHVEPGEDLLAALRREIREETGCLVRPDRLLAIYSRLEPRPLVIFLFACTYLAGALRPSAETPTVAWAGPPELARLSGALPAYGPLRDAVEERTSLVYRAYRLDPEVEIASWIV